MNVEKLEPWSENCNPMEYDAFFHGDKNGNKCYHSSYESLK